MQKSSEMVLALLRFRLVLLFQWLCSFLSCFSNKITVFWGGLKAENTSSDEYFSRTPFWCVAAGHAAFKVNAQGYTDLLNWTAVYKSARTSQFQQSVQE